MQTLCVLSSLLILITDYRLSSNYQQQVGSWIIRRKCNLSLLEETQSMKITLVFQMSWWYLIYIYIWHIHMTYIYKYIMLLIKNSNTKLDWQKNLVTNWSWNKTMFCLWFSALNILSVYHLECTNACNLTLRRQETD